MGNLRKWSTTASGNANVAGGVNAINFAEGQVPSTLNNSDREQSAQIRLHYQFNQWAWVEHSGTASVATQTTVKISGDQTGACVANRGIRFTGGSATVYAYVTSSSFTAETTITINSQSGSLSSSMTICALGPQFESLPATASGFISSDSASKMIATSLTTYVTSNSVSTGYEALGKLKGVNQQTGATYELALTDAGKVLEFSRASSVLVTIPTSASVAFPVGTYIDWIQTGAGTLSFTAGAGETLTGFGSSKQAGGQYAGGALVKTAVNLWRLIGNLA